MDREASRMGPPTLGIGYLQVLFFLLIHFDGWKADSDIIALFDE